MSEVREHNLPPFEQGVAAFERGADEDDNPYTYTDERKGEWRNGFKHGLETHRSMVRSIAMQYGRADMVRVIDNARANDGR